MGSPDNKDFIEKLLEPNTPVINLVKAVANYDNIQTEI